MKRVYKILLYVLLLVLIIALFYLIYIKYFSSDTTDDDIKEKEEYEVSVKFDSEILKINNTKIINEDGEYYLEFSVNRLDNEVDGVNLSIHIVNGDSEFDSEVSLNKIEENGATERIELTNVSGATDFDKLEITFYVTGASSSAVDNKNIIVKTG